MAPEDTTDHTADPWPRCEFAMTIFSEGECQRPGEVQLNGSLLCVPHAELLRLEAREDTLLGTVFEMDKGLTTLTIAQTNFTGSGCWASGTRF
jgi:hypothetical protein